LEVFILDPSLNKQQDMVVKKLVSSKICRKIKKWNKKQ